ncbi:hypothetical protein [Luteibacter rhizovicinus]|uniref:hypothetical protein n=1 Tax=Luteibacter rhizovicinus TaxID=242606 RepID=UPI000AE830B0|nr:hypothetical protein [Luteibacter rhizovicinus]
MRYVAALLLVIVSSAICAADAKPPASLVGLWQFRDNTVWISIQPDGTTFQCRVAPGGTVFKSEGHFTSTHSIQWKTIWGTDDVTLKVDHLVVHGKWGDFSYHRTAVPMGSPCARPGK